MKSDKRKDLIIPSGAGPFKVMSPEGQAAWKESERLIERDLMNKLQPHIQKIEVAGPLIVGEKHPYNCYRIKVFMNGDTLIIMVPESEQDQAGGPLNTQED